MYSSLADHKGHPIDFYKQEPPPQPQGQGETPATAADNNMIIQVSPNNNNNKTQLPMNMMMIVGDNSSGSDDNKAPKKRAETWVQEETRTLITLRREIDSLFNTSKSNKHLWDQISAKMREKGFDRSPNMCTDKWRNLLKEFKKCKQQPSSDPKMFFYTEIEDILRDRSKSSSFSSPAAVAAAAAAAAASRFKTSSPPSKIDPFMHFSDKGIDDTSITFGPVEDKGRATLNLETQLGHDGHPLAITAADAITASGVPPWNWRETPGNGEQSNSYDGKVIFVKLGDYTKRIGIDGSADAIKEAIKSAFRLRTKRAFWLEDEDNIVRSLDRDMPLGNYILHVDEGLTIKVCMYEESDHLPVHAEDKTFYTEDDFRQFLSRRGWTCLREYNGYRNVDTMDELCPGALYRGGVQ